MLNGIPRQCFTTATWHYANIHIICWRADFNGLSRTSSDVREIFKSWFWIIISSTFSLRADGANHFIISAFLEQVASSVVWLENDLYVWDIGLKMFLFHFYGFCVSYSFHLGSVCTYRTLTVILSMSSCPFVFVDSWQHNTCCQSLPAGCTLCGFQQKKKKKKMTLACVYVWWELDLLETERGIVCVLRN